MRIALIRVHLAFVTMLTLTLTLTTAVALAAEEEGFQPLIEGNDVNQFQLTAIDADTISIKDGVVYITGRPNGYFATKDEYKNYILRFEWMYERPEDLESDEEFRGNSGVLVHIVGEHKVWPQCIEVQLQNRDAGRIFGIFGSKFEGAVAPEQRQAAQKEAIKPVGQWNEMEIVSQDGKLACQINGKPIDQGQGADPAQGQIGFQSEGRPIQFRNMRIRVLD